MAAGQLGFAPAAAKAWALWLFLKARRAMACCIPLLVRCNVYNIYIPLYIYTYVICIIYTHSIYVTVCYITHNLDDWAQVGPIFVAVVHQPEIMTCTDQQSSISIEMSVCLNLRRRFFSTGKSPFVQGRGVPGIIFRDAQVSYQVGYMFLWRITINIPLTDIPINPGTSLVETNNQNATVR